jgi:hypothetical protein
MFESAVFVGSGKEREADGPARGQTNPGLLFLLINAASALRAIHLCIQLNN